jgi:hypothetical protein
LCDPLVMKDLLADLSLVIECVANSSPPAENRHTRNKTNC